jgi:hypothetical protein
MARSLNEIMEFDHIIRVNADGTITEDLDMSTMDSGSYFDLAVDEDGTDIFDMSAGWTLLSGFTGQYGYNGPVMHASEYVGGGLERHIRETPGYYVVLIVNALETHCEDCAEFEHAIADEPAGWAVAYKPLDD